MAAQGDDWGYRPALDGLRTVAVYLVVLFHAGLVHFGNGYIGVDVFFVLSGFLVTNVMLAEHRETGRVRLSRFYARRVRRLLPAAVALVIGICALSLLVQPRLTRIGFIGDARSSLLYYANWHFYGSATNYFADDVDRSPFLHFWSLAIEEQFYFVFPLVLIGLLALTARRKRTDLVPIALGALLVASLVAQILLARTDPLRAYYGTDARLYQLLTGATLAAAWQLRRRPAERSASQTRAIGIGGALALVGLVVVASDVVDMSVSTRGILAASVSLAVVAALELAPRSAPAWLLSRPTMVYLGRISYGTYLWHWPLIVMIRVVFDVSPLQMAVLAGTGATAMAALSFQLLESPIRRAPHLTKRPSAAVAIGLSCSILVAVIAMPVTLRSERRPALAARGSDLGVASAETDAEAAAKAAELAVALAVVLPIDVDVEPTKPPPFDEVACRPEALDACVLHRGAGMTLHLIGDSNAQVLIPMLTVLAAEHDFTFSVSTAIGCPWQHDLAWAAKDATLVSRCTKLRDQWYEQIIPALKPDIIVAAHVPRDPGSREDAFYESIESDGRPMIDVVAEATADSLDTLVDLGSRVLLFEPLPYGPTDPTQCLSGSTTVGGCAYRANVTAFPTEVLYRTEDERRDEVFGVDADALACPFLPVCVPMIDGRLVFRNQFHLSNAWMLEHRHEWWNLMVESGALDDLDFTE